MHLVLHPLFAQVTTSDQLTSALGTAVPVVIVCAVALFFIVSRVPARRRMRRCPACAELVLTEALKCKHCGERMEPAIRAPACRERASRKPSWKWVLFAVAFIAVGAVFPFTPAAVDARKKAREANLIDSYLAVLNPDEVVLDGKVVSRDHAEARLAEQKLWAMRPDALGQVNKYLLERTSVWTRTTLFARRVVIAGDARLWVVFLAGSISLIVLGLSIIGWQVLARRRRGGHESEGERSLGTDAN